MLSSWKSLSYKPIPSVLSAEQRALLKERLDTYHRTGTLAGHHPVLGWTNTQGSSSDHKYRFNSAGVRSDHDFSPRPSSACALRLAAFGDSFTLGNGVPNEDTWEECLARSRGDFEVLNFGVGAYGFDQAYLRYLHEGRNFHADVVILGFMSENIFRNVNVFRPFYSSDYWGNLLPKPRFLLENGQLSLKDNPLRTVQDVERLLNDDAEVLRELGEHDFFYQNKYHAGSLDFFPCVRLGKLFLQTLRDQSGEPVLTKEGSYNTRGEAFRVTDKLFEEFYRSALANDSLPLILVFPDARDIGAFPRRRSTRYRPLLSRFEEKGYRFVDLMPAFIQDDPSPDRKELSIDMWGHYSPKAHAITAAALLKYLDEHGLTSRPMVRQLVMKERARLGSSSHDLGDAAVDRMRVPRDTLAMVLPLMRRLLAVLAAVACLPLGIAVFALVATFTLFALVIRCCDEIDHGCEAICEAGRELAVLRGQART